MVALVQWSWEETHVQEVVGLNSGTRYWMDIFDVKIVMFVSKRPKKRKRGRECPIKKMMMIGRRPGATLAGRIRSPHGWPASHPHSPEA